MVKKPSVTVYYRPTKKKDSFFLNLRYHYDGKHFPIPLGETIRKIDWDMTVERVHYHVAKSTEINAKINDVTSYLEYKSNLLLEKGETPTIEIMKWYWEFHKAATKNHKKRDEWNKPMFEQIAKDATAEVETLQAKIEELQEKKERSLRKIGALPFQEQDDEEAKSIKEFIGLLDEYIQEKTGVSNNATKEELKNVSRATSGFNKGLRTWAKTLVEFTESKQVRSANLKIGFDNLSQKFYDTYALFLQSPAPHGRNLKNNTFGGQIKKLKTFIKWVELDKQLPVDRRYTRFKVKNEEKEIIALTMEDIDLLYQWEPEQNRIHRDAIPWRKYIDFTVFSFLTSLRISDIHRVKGFRFENGCILGKTKKTGGNFKIPMSLDPRIKQILERYNNDMLFFSKEEYNDKIKILLKLFFEQYNLYSRPITITNKKYIDPNPIEKTYTFYTCIRRTATDEDGYRTFLRNLMTSL